MDNWIMWLVAIPFVWFGVSIGIQIIKLLHLWLGLKMAEIRERINL